MKRIKMDIQEPSLENPLLLQYVGQRAAEEVFAELRDRLEHTGYLPDDHFLLDSAWRDGREIPKGADILCKTDYGDSEGICLNIYLKWYDEQLEQFVTESFANGKTIDDTESDLDRMFLITSAVTKAFHSDGDHGRYIQTDEKEQLKPSVIHLSGEEQRLLIDSLVDKRIRLKEEAQTVDRLLRRVTGSVTAMINEIGERPLRISDFDRAVLAIQDGDLAALRDVCPSTAEEVGELLIHAAGRAGNVGRKMTELLLVDRKDIPHDVYLAACKKPSLQAMWTKWF